jgi:hypothetical protein
MEPFVVLGKPARVKRELVARFGNKCQRCGYDRSFRALQFHHIDKSEKKDWSKGRGNAAPAEIEQHPERFELLCANCHFEEHERLDALTDYHFNCLGCGRPVILPREGYRGDFKVSYCTQKCQWAHKPALAKHVTIRFWKFVVKTEGCWHWTGCTVANTGQIRAPGNRGKATGRSATAVSWEIHNGPIPEGWDVFRRCDGENSCVRPDHLYLVKRDGTEVRKRAARRKRSLSTTRKVPRKNRQPSWW